LAAVLVGKLLPGPIPASTVLVEGFSPISFIAAGPLAAPKVGFVWRFLIASIRASYFSAVIWRDRGRHQGDFVLPLGQQDNEDLGDGPTCPHI
jgi:hypothetical protein